MSLTTGASIVLATFNLFPDCHTRSQLEGLTPLAAETVWFVYGDIF